MTVTELSAEVDRLSKLLDAGIAALREQAREAADAENQYRKAVAQVWTRTPDGTVPERQAKVQAETADLRYRRDVADGMRQAALEAVRSRRTQLSAAQSLAAAHRTEAEFARVGADG